MTFTLRMLGLNRRLAVDSGVPRRVSRIGIAFTVSLPAGLVLVGMSFLVEAGSGASTVLQAFGGAVGRPAWLSWPIWWILLGRHIVRVRGQQARSPR